MVSKNESKINREICESIYCRVMSRSSETNVEIWPGVSDCPWF